MVALELVKQSNAKLRDLGPDLVALFVGGTSGIGEATLKAFVGSTLRPHVYVVGRSASAAHRIIEECATLNKDGTVEFLQANVNELREVDRICKEIEGRQQKLNLLVQTQGNLNMKGRDESPEGIDRKFTLNFYSRMRFISNLLPLLRTSSTTTPHFSRVLTVLGPGNEGALNLDDLDLKQNFSPGKCANHSITMTDFMVEEFASREPGTSFIHSSPGIVDTGITRDLPLWVRIPFKILSPLLKPFSVSVEETGQRQLFLATNGLFPPQTASVGAPLAAGVSVPSGMSIAKGSNGAPGSGAYLVNWNDEITGKEELLKQYREKGVSKIVWEHTMGIFEKVEKINQKRA